MQLMIVSGGRKMELSKYVGKKIREYRKKNNMTQKELGDKIGVKNNTISAYERGAISPEQDMLFELCKVFNISVNDLFPPKDNATDELERALKMASSNLDADQIELLNSLIEKTLTYKGEDREKFLESIRFIVEYHDKMNNDN